MDSPRFPRPVLRSRLHGAITAGDPDAAARAMHEHFMLVSDVALLREQS
ncbi:hypothetical protein ACIBL3_11150 [Kribbella sp. NPDC050124]